MDSTLADPLVGAVLEGRYRILGRTARGGMATVYRAFDERLERTVAVKVMHPGIAEDPAFLARFSREAKAAARLSSPYVVAVYDQGVQDGLAFLVMEYVPGRTLRDLIAERGRLTPAEALSVLEPVLVALAAAHRAGLMHGDVKPENVLLGDDGAVKVADFGLARAVEASGQTATRGVLLGTVAYLAPEQVVSGDGAERSDVYAAGIVLFEVLTGTVPFAGDTAMSVAYRHVHEDVPAPSSRAPVPAALDRLVLRATARDPEERPADAAALLTELRDARSQLDLPAVPLPAAGPLGGQQHRTAVVPVDDRMWAAPAPRAGQPRRRRRGWLALLLVLLLGVAAAGAGWWLGAGRYTTTPSFYRLTQSAAQAKAKAAGFAVTVGPAAYDDTVPAGSVVRQDPAAGARILRGGTVTLILSKGPQQVTVPDLAGQPQADAETALAKLTLTPQSTTAYSDTVPAGQVVSTSPAAGTAVRRYSVVTLVVSRGPPPVTVPRVVGQPLDQATAALKKAGLGWTVTEAYDDTAPKGQVTAQDPAGGQLPKGQKVKLVVSKGPPLVAVPDVTGMTRPEAEAALRAAGFQPRVFGGSGRVIQQSPAGGGQAPKGSTVTLLVLL